MKKMIAILLVMASVLLVSACGANNASETNTKTIAAGQTAAESTTTDTASANGYTVKIVSAYKTIDSNGDPMAAVELEFTNANSTPASFMSCAQLKGFQNGVELRKDEMFLERDYDWDSYYTEIKAGATISVFRPLPLQNETDPIELSVEIIDISNGKRLSSASATVELSN